jgi:O-antigen/teichoic acid export membrane protein
LFLMGALAGLESYRTLGFAGIASGLMYVAVSVTAAKIAGLNGAVAGVALSGLLQAALLWQAVRVEARRQGIPLQIAGLGAEAGILLRFAIPAALNGFIQVPALWASNAFLARQEEGYALLALFTAANNFRIIVLFLPNIVNNVSMSLLNYQKGLHDNRRYRRVFWTNLAATLCVVVCGALAVALVGRWLLSWFGPGFSQGYSTLLVLMVVTLLESASTALFQVIQSRERIWWSVGAVFLPCYGTIAAVAWWLTPGYGALGLALAHFAGWAVALIAIVAIVSRLGVYLPTTTTAPVRA